VLLALLVVASLLWRIDRSPFGMALRAIRDNDLRAAFIGIPVRAYRWRALVISGAVTGLAGGLYGQLDRQVTPEQLHWIFSAQLVVATLLGGTRRFLGPVAGAGAFVVLRHVATRFALSHGLVLGGLLILTVFACPGGLAEAVAAVARRPVTPEAAWNRPVQR
jgi:branched-chain amino acid transport system permease protein